MMKPYSAYSTLRAMLFVCFVALFLFLDLYGAVLSRNGRLTALVLLFFIVLVWLRPKPSSFLFRPVCFLGNSLLRMIRSLSFFLFYFLFICPAVIGGRVFFRRKNESSLESVWVDIRENSYFQRDAYRRQKTIYSNILLFLHSGHPFLYLPFLLFFVVAGGVFYMSETNGAFSSFLRFLLP
jgi:hypothetical protein